MIFSPAIMPLLQVGFIKYAEFLHGHAVIVEVAPEYHQWLLPCSQQIFWSTTMSQRKCYTGHQQFASWQQCRKQRPSHGAWALSQAQKSRAEFWLPFGQGRWQTKARIRCCLTMCRFATSTLCSTAIATPLLTRVSTSPRWEPLTRTRLSMTSRRSTVGQMRANRRAKWHQSTLRTYFRSSECRTTSMQDIQIKVNFNAEVPNNSIAFAVLISYRLLNLESDGSKFNVVY